MPAPSLDESGSRLSSTFIASILGTRSHLNKILRLVLDAASEKSVPSCSPILISTFSHSCRPLSESHPFQRASGAHCSRQRWSLLLLCPSAACTSTDCCCCRCQLRSVRAVSGGGANGDAAVRESGLLSFSTVVTMMEWIFASSNAFAH